MYQNIDNKQGIYKSEMTSISKSCRFKMEERKTNTYVKTPVKNKVKKSDKYLSVLH